MKKTFLTLSLIVISFLSLMPKTIDAETPDIDISLITIGPGKPIYVWWGHTAYVITDHSSGKEYFINFGLFHFDSDNFYLNFVLGKLYFMVGASNSKWEIENYSAQDRFIVRQYLNLTDEKKNKLYTLIRENLKEENRVYRYDHYYDNCATRPRDLMDITLNGKFRKANSTMTGLSIREHTRRFTQDHHFVQWWLMYGQGGIIDSEASQWDVMFLPMELYNSFKNMPGLVEKEEILYPKELHIPQKPENIYYLLFPFLAGLALSILPVSIFFFPKISLLNKISAVYEQFLLAIIGLLGSILLFLMTCTEHTVVAYNFNALLNPFIALVPLFLPGKYRKQSRQYLWMILWVIAVLMAVIQPVFIHKNLNIILFFLPVYSVLGGVPLLQRILKRRVKA